MSARAGGSFCRASSLRVIGSTVASAVASDVDSAVASDVASSVASTVASEVASAVDSTVASGVDSTVGSSVTLEGDGMGTTPPLVGTAVGTGGGASKRLIFTSSIATPFALSAAVPNVIGPMPTKLASLVLTGVKLSTLTASKLPGASIFTVCQLVEGSTVASVGGVPAACPRSAPSL